MGVSRGDWCFYTVSHKIAAGQGLTYRMAQNRSAPAKRPRGRPRAYEPDVALARALDAFWEGGYSGTSLDQLVEATGMNRPSLYAAFGDKQALYLKALRSYSEASG